MTYGTEHIAEATGLNTRNVRDLARRYGKGHRLRAGWSFDETDMEWFVLFRPRRGWPKGKPRGRRET